MTKIKLYTMILEKMKSHCQEVQIKSKYIITDQSDSHLTILPGQWNSENEKKKKRIEIIGLKKLLIGASRKLARAKRKFQGMRRLTICSISSRRSEVAGRSVE